MRIGAGPVLGNRYMQLHIRDANHQVAQLTPLNWHPARQAALQKAA